MQMGMRKQDLKSSLKNQQLALRLETLPRHKGAGSYDMMTRDATVHHDVPCPVTARDARFDALMAKLENSGEPTQKSVNRYGHA